PHLAHRGAAEATNSRGGAEIQPVPQNVARDCKRGVRPCANGCARRVRNQAAERLVGNRKRAPTPSAPTLSGINDRRRASAAAETISDVHDMDPAFASFTPQPN